jgi:hypothetical protein
MRCHHMCPHCRKDFEHKVPADSQIDKYAVYCIDCSIVAATEINLAGTYVDKGRIEQRREIGIEDSPSPAPYAILGDGDIEQSLEMAYAACDEASEKLCAL